MSMTCAVASLCGQLAYGYTMPPANKNEATIVVAAYQPVNGCESDITDTRLSSGCRTIPKPRDHFKVVYGVAPVGREFWPKPQLLPPITVTKQKPRKVRGSVKNASLKTATTNVVMQSVAAQIADQLVRKGIVYGAQTAGVYATVPLVPVLGIAAPILGAWGGCTVAIYGMLYHDFAVKERWDLNPQIAVGNYFHSLYGCSPVGFIQRMQEAKTDRERIFALAAGTMVWAPNPFVSMAGQLAPAANALLPDGSNNSLFGGLIVRNPSNPYRSAEAWAVPIP